MFSKSKRNFGGDIFLLVYFESKIVYAPSSSDILFTAQSLNSLYDVHHAHSVDLIFRVQVDFKGVC